MNRRAAVLVRPADALSQGYGKAEQKEAPIGNAGKSELSAECGQQSADSGQLKLQPRRRCAPRVLAVSGKLLAVSL
jgi:hypothetical protein